MIQIVMLKISSKGVKPQINSITSKISHTKPRKIIGPSSNCSNLCKRVDRCLLNWGFFIIENH